jgi:hypothetical protein
MRFVYACSCIVTILLSYPSIEPLPVSEPLPPLLQAGLNRTNVELKQHPVVEVAVKIIRYGLLNYSRDLLDYSQVLMDNLARSASSLSSADFRGCAARKREEN